MLSYNSIRIVTIALSLALTNVASALIIDVPDDFDTIQEAIDDSEDGDTVLVQPGTYTESINFGGRDIVVGSLFLMTGDAAYVDSTVIDADGARRVVNIRNGETEDAILTGFTIRNGDTDYGGGVYINGAAPTLDHLLITGNNANTWGGGIYCTHDASPTLLHLTLVGNTAGNANGGLRTNDNSTADIRNSIFYDNNPPAMPGGLSITYSDIEGGYGGAGNINQDPLFADQDNDDFHLTEDSPCIDTGDPDSPTDPDTTRADMGVFYFHQEPAPRILVFPDTLDFGGVRVDEELAGTITIVNSGRAVLEVQHPTTDGDPFRADQEDWESAFVDPEDTLEVEAFFAPDTTGDFEGEFIIESNDPRNEFVTVVLLGTGAEPAIATVPDTLDFGGVVVDESKDLTLAIVNVGLADLTVSDVAVAGDNFSADFEGEFTVAPDSGVGLTVTFTPDDFGDFEGSLTITSDDPVNGELTVPLYGTSREFVINVPDDYETIQEAIDASEDGDTVLVQPDTYMERINFGGNNIVVGSLFLTTGDDAYLDSTIIDADGGGSVVLFRSGETEEAVLTGFTLRNGDSNYGSGIYISGAGPTLDHLVITANHANNWGGGIYATHDSSPIMSHLTIYGNVAETGNGGLHAFDNTTVDIVNSILWGNTPTAVTGGLNLTYCDVEGGYAGNGNLNRDPQFADEDNGDFRLTEDSPCIDVGDPDSGNDPDFTRADMGAYFFFQEPLPEIAVTPDTLNFGEVRVGVESGMMVSVMNTGLADLIVHHPWTDGDPFRADLDEWGSAGVDPGDTLEVEAFFAPDSAGDFEGLFFIASNDSANDTLSVVLLGTGIAPVIVISPDTLDFGEALVDESVERILTFSNEGDADYRVTDIYVEAGAGDEYFSVDFVDAFTVEPDSEATVTFTFTPGEAGEFDVGAAIVTDDPANEELYYRMTGIGRDRVIEEVGSIDTPGRAYDVDVYGGFAYIADWTSGLRIIDVSDPENPQEVGDYDTGGALRVTVEGSYAFVADPENGLYIIDVSDPENPEELGLFDTPGQARDVAVVGDYAYVTTGDEGLIIIDISDPANMEELSTFDTPDDADGIAVEGDYVYIGDFITFQVIDVSNPRNPEGVGEVETPGFAYGVAVYGDHAYVADGAEGGLRIIDIAPPENPGEIAGLNTPGLARNIVVIGDKVYLADERSGLQVIDISDPENPDGIVAYDTDGIAYGIDVIGQFAYVADDENGLVILDISDFAQYPLAVVDPERLDFGELFVDQSRELRLTVSNDGNWPLTISGISIAGDQFSSDFQDVVVVDPEESVDFAVSFAPQEGGDFEGTLTISSDDPYSPQTTVALSGTGAIPSVIDETGSLLEFFAGVEDGCAYDNWVSHISEGISRAGYNDYGPAELDRQTTGFGAYRVIDSLRNPDQILDDWYEIFSGLLDGDADAALNSLEGSDFLNQYQLVRLEDGEKNYLIMRELLNEEYFDDNGTGDESDDVTGSFDYGWGLYVFDPDAASPNVVIEAPHSCDDYITPYVAIDAFLTIGARALFVAGAGRETAWTEQAPYTNGKSLADPTRVERSAFHRAHMAAVDQIEDELVLQVHSYDSESHPDLWPVELSTRLDYYPNPPVFDFDNHFDMVSLTPAYPVAANSLGNEDHDSVRVDDYYAVWYDSNVMGTYAFNDSLDISDGATLIGISTNRQMLYSHADHDTLADNENWLHIEEDEFPDVINEDILDFYAVGALPTYENYAGAVQFYRPVYEAVEAYFGHPRLHNVPDDYQSIQAAIDASVDGDTVLVQPGSYVERIDFGGRSITVGSLFLTTGEQAYIDSTVLDSGEVNRSIVAFRSGETNAARLTGFTIRNGDTDFGGGIYLNGASPTLDHLVIRDNQVSQRGAGLYATNGSNPILTNLTFSGNDADEDLGALGTFAGSDPEIASCIFWNNTPVDMPAGLTLNYSDVEGGYAGNGNIDEDPLFADADNDDYRLTGNSPCIDAGDPNAPDDPDTTRADMGAFYFDQSTEPPFIVVTPDTLRYGDVPIDRSRILSLTIGNQGAGDLTLFDIAVQGDLFSVEFEADLVIEPNDSARINVTFSPVEEGDFEGSLTISSNDRDNGELTVYLYGTGREPVISEIGDYDTPGHAFSACVVGDYAYVADMERGLRVIDVSDPENPEEAGAYDTPGWAQGVAVSGDYAYVADYSEGLMVIDISDPANPDEVSAYDTPGNARDVVVVGTLAYVAADGSGLRIIDISDPENLDEVGSFDTPGSAYGVAVADGFAYVADSNTLQIIDVSDPANPDGTAAYETDGFNRGVDVYGDYVYVADGQSGLLVIDVSDPENPDEAGVFDTPGLARGVTVVGTYAFVADDAEGLRLIDVYQPQNLDEVGSLDTPGDAYDVTIAANYAYVADYENGLRIIDVSDFVPHPEIVLTPTPLEFDPVRIGLSETMTLTISNDGVGDLIVSDISVEGEYFTASFEERLIVAVDSSYELDVTFAPIITGDFEGILSISSNDLDNSLTTIDLFGVGASNPPDVLVPIEDLMFEEDSGPWEIADLDTIFSDPDEDEMTFRATAEDSLIADIDEESNVLTLSAPDDFNGADLEVVITADDGQGGMRSIALRSTRSGSIPGHARELRRINAAQSLEWTRTASLSRALDSPRRDPSTDTSFLVTIDPVNDAPFWVDPPEEFVVDEEDLIEFMLIADDVDLAMEGDELELTMIDDDGTAQRGAEFVDNDDNSGTFTWVTDFADEGEYSPRFQVEDRAGETTEVSVRLVVTHVNQPPYPPNPIPDQQFDEDSGPWEIADLDTVFIDPDDDPLDFSVDAEEPLEADIDEDSHVLTLDAPENYNGADLEVIVTADDGIGGRRVMVLRTVNRGAALLNQRGLRRTNTSQPRRDLTGDDVFSVIINAVNDEPFWVDPPEVIESDENELVEFTLTADDVDLDIEGDELTLTFPDPGGLLDRGAEFTDNNDNTCTFSWQTDFEDEGVYDLTFEVEDQGNAVTEVDIELRIINVNRPPVLDEPMPDVQLDEDDEEQLVADLNDHFSDPDGDQLNYAPSEQMGVTARVDGSDLYIEPDLDWNGEVEVIIVASDGDLTAADTFMVTVEGINDPPRIAEQVGDIEVDEDPGRVDIGDLDEIFVDPEGDSLSFAIEAAPEGLGMVITDPWNFLYFDPVLNFNIPEGAEVTIRATEYSPDTLTTDMVFTVIINAVNDPPIIVMQVEDIVIDEDPDPRRIDIGDLDDIFNDPDEDPMEFSFSGAPDGLHMEINQWNFLLFTPEDDFNIADGAEITVTAEDSVGATTDMVFNITINPVNDAPGSFSLLSPADGAEIEREANEVAFEWEEAVNVDDDDLVYTLFIGVEYEDIDTVVTLGGIEEAGVTLENLDSLLIEAGVYSHLELTVQVEWWVEVTDGEFSAESREQWELIVPVPLSVPDEGTGLPTEFSLSYAYPNPFNATTRITYALPSASRVTLRVYDLSGQNVTTLFEGDRQPGVHATTLNAADLPSGLYFVRLQAADYVATRKVMLIR